ncbi:hypothetical protein [Ruminococcus sp.]|uniref:hypothetical protein n=1 Tax=Ruminococcus sp. TaxID=41978 RepID=UPI002B6A30C1|nr:hypothetical protein [Ruminococcus sp.]HOA00135.1 hypothetical protein [Ruminococcus sp.]HOH86822.1 hypothetical protein [Ruminococcus sp.]
MAIRKDLDDMLNSLMDGGGSGSSSTPARSHTTPRAVRKSKFDNMSVDDLLHALEEEKHHIEDEQPVIPDNTPPASWEFAPPTHEFAPAPENIAPEEPSAEEAPNIIAEVMHTEPTAEMTRVFDTVPASEELPKPAKKKKIVITGEPPDYEALRRQEFEREQQAQRAAEAAAEEARAAERAKRAAEAAAERQRLAEEAEQRRLAREEAERQRRLAEEAEQARLAEEAERRRLAQEEAERQRRLAEEAEQARLAEEAERRRQAEEAERQRLAEEAEKQRRIEEMKRLAEAAEEKTADPVTFAEEIIVNSAAEEDVDAAIEALGEAAAAPAEETAEAAAETAKPRKISLFKKLKNKGKEEPKPETEAAPEDGLFEPAEEPSATDLIDAAIAAIHDEEISHDSDPVGNMLENIREDAAEAIADMDEVKEEEPAAASDQPLIMSDEDIISGLTPDLKERFDALPADKQQQVIEMRRAQMGAIAPPIVIDEPEEDILPEEDTDFVEPETEEKADEPEQSEEKAPEKSEEPKEEAKTEEAAPAAEEKPKGKVTSALEKILDEDPDELIAQRKENVESSSADTAKDPNRKKLLYTILGVVMTAFAVIGIIATIAKGVGLAKSFTSGEVKKDSFTQMVYPAAIMDIEPFSDPSQLTSEQIVTATIWSIIMDDSKISKYDLTLDTVTIPDVDVEKYAVELFGENIPQFNHCTVGPIESRFYYSDGAYNVKVKPITHTYSPEVKSIVKNGSEYTLTVDYIAELPQWMEKSVAKQAEYKLTEKEDGTFRFNSMKILSVNSGNI